MGNKLRWSKQFANDYLADTELNNLTLAEHGLQQILFCLAQTQTDRPGYLVKNGVSWGPKEVQNRVKKHTKGGLKRGKTGVKTVLEKLWKQDPKTGTYYSPYIVKQVEASEVSRKGGVISAARRVQRSVQRAVQHAVAPEPEPEPDTRTTTVAVERSAGKTDPSATAREVLAALGANGNQADLARLEPVCRKHPRAAVLGALDYALERRAKGEIDSNVLGYLISVVGKVPPRAEHMTEAERQERRLQQAVARELKDLSLPPDRFRDRIEVLVRQYDTSQRTGAKDQLYADERNQLVDATNPEAWYERYLQHLEAD